MSRNNSDNEYRVSQFVTALVYLLLVCGFGMAAAVAETTERTSSSLHYADGGRAKTQTPEESRDVYGALETDGERGRSTATGFRSKGDSTTATSQSASSQFWIFAADVVLFGDDDRDGFFYGIDLLFDADTVWSAADVYAVTYLSYEGGPWNEYAVTEDFTIFSASADDEYVVVTELESGYPTGSYDILVELFDAQSGEYLASIGPENDSGLGYLPLEDYKRDAPLFDPPVAISHGSGGGGSAGLLFSGLLLVPLLLRRRKTRPEMPF